MTPAEIAAHNWLGLEAQAHARTQAELAAAKETVRALTERVQALEARCHPKDDA